MSTQVAVGTPPTGVAGGHRARALRASGTAVAALAVAVFAFVVALIRQPGSARDNLWAEDGTRFLTGAYLYSLPRAIFEPYSGYLHLYPRLAGAVAAALPLSRATDVLSGAGCLATAACAAAVVVSTRGLITRLPLRILAGIALPLLPTAGSAATANVANAHVWLDLFAVVMLFRPIGADAGRGRRLETVVAWLAVLLAIGSDPQALILIPVVAVRIAVAARRGSGLAGEIVTAALLVVVGAVQVVSVATNAVPHTGLHPSFTQLARLYLRDVLDTLVIGARRSLAADTRTLVLPVLAVAVVLLVTLAVSRLRALLALALLALSLPLWGFAPWLKWTPALMTYSHLQTDDARYTVLSAALVTLALTACLDSWLGRLPWPGVLAVAVVVAVAAGVLWAPSEGVGPGRTPNFGSGLRAARASCVGRPGATRVYIAGSPVDFGALVPCSRVG